MDHIPCCQAFALSSCYSETIKKWTVGRPGNKATDDEHISIQFPASQPHSINGILQYTPCPHLSIHGAAISIPLSACLQGKKWISIHDFNYVLVLNCVSIFVNFKIDHRLAWPERIKILSGSACGLAYLHSSIPPFIHHDVKSWVFSSYLHCKEQLYLNKQYMTHFNFSRQNILLDAALTPKVADFGFVTPMPVNVGGTAIVTAAGAMTLAGSRGYLAPEFTEGRHGIKSDVYSYGVVSFTYIQI